MKLYALAVAVAVASLLFALPSASALPEPCPDPQNGPDVGTGGTLLPGQSLAISISKDETDTLFLRAVASNPFDYVVYNATGAVVSSFNQQPFVYANLLAPVTEEVCLVVTNPSSLEMTVAMGMTNLGL